MKFKIFICSDCKSCHQAFSHRCKSVTMSNWSMAEVDVLRHENGGAARSKCPLGRAPARLLRLLRARLVALGGVHSQGERPAHRAPSHCLGCSS